MVIFGASGDLTKRKILPSLFNLFVSGGLMRENFFVTGVARTRFDDASYRLLAADAVRKAFPSASGADLEAFCEACHYIPGDYNDDGTYAALGKRLGELSLLHATQGNLIFNLATPPSLYGPVTGRLGANGLILKGDSTKPFHRIMVEKPFGTDLESARELNRTMLRWVEERQIFRIDHYLGKNTVQNIMVFRFANPIFGPVWNSGFVDHVQITVAEEIGVEGRAGYFESAGLVRDILQNHMLNLLGLVAMEKPASLDAEAIRDGKSAVLRSIRRFDPAGLDRQIVRGQYAAGGGEAGYRQEPGVAPDSCVETYFAARLFIDNKRWKGVPFYLRAGKRLGRKETSVTVVFKNAKDCVFRESGIGHPPNRLVFSIQPEQKVSLGFIVKIPGARMCLSGQNLEFSYNSLAAAPLTGDYERIILDCMMDDQTLFWRKDGIEESWRLLTPVVSRWQSCPVPEKQRMMHLYPAGSGGPAAADELIRRDGREWL
jgi:glucose-6-phosphate 1-dehydrogenase